MLARDYNKQIEVLEYTETPDGFGGNTVSAVSLGYSWARLENKVTSISQRVTALGITDLVEPLIFKVRYRNDLAYQGKTLALEYRGEYYVIQSITDVDKMRRELEIVCSKSNLSLGPEESEETPVAPYTVLGTLIDWNYAPSIEEDLIYYTSLWEYEDFPDGWLHAIDGVPAGLVVRNNADNNVYRIENFTPLDYTKMYFTRLINDNDLTVFNDLSALNLFTHIHDGSGSYLTSYLFLDSDNQRKIIYKTAEGNVIIDHPPAP